VCACDTEIKIACSRNHVRNIFDPATARGEFASSYQMARVYDEIFAVRLPGKMNAWVGGWLDLLHAMAAAKKMEPDSRSKKMYDFELRKI
jgi:1,4-dihydroxy-2-naphthoyl-CoA synthase